MLANSVRESTTTTGTGPFTLDGSSGGGRTVASQLSVGELATFFARNDDGSEFETFIGALNSSGELERIVSKDGSGPLPVNFSAGTKQIVISPSVSNLVNNAEGFSSLAGSSSMRLMKPSNFIRLNGSETLVANQIYYIPIFITRAVTIDMLSILVSTASGTSANSLILGLYEANDGVAGLRLAQTAVLDPSNAGFVMGSIPEMELQFGWYFASVWCDVAISARANDGSIVMHNPFQSANASNLNNASWQFRNGQTGLTELPANGNANNANVFAPRVPCIMVGHT